MRLGVPLGKKSYSTMSTIPAVARFDIDLPLFQVTRPVRCTSMVVEISMAVGLDRGLPAP